MATKKKIEVDLGDQISALLEGLEPLIWAAFKKKNPGQSNVGIEIFFDSMRRTVKNESDFTGMDFHFQVGQTQCGSKKANAQSLLNSLENIISQRMKSRGRRGIEADSFLGTCFLTIREAAEEVGLSEINLFSEKERALKSGHRKRTIKQEGNVFFPAAWKGGAR